MAVAEVLRLPWIIRRRQSGINRQRLVGGIGILENAHKSMKTHGQMRYPYRFDDCQYDGPSDQVSRRVLSMRFLRADVEIGEVSRPRFQRIGES